MSWEAPTSLIRLIVQQAAHRKGIVKHGGISDSVHLLCEVDYGMTAAVAAVVNTGSRLSALGDLR